MPLNQANGGPLWYVRGAGHFNEEGDLVRNTKHKYAMMWPKDRPDRGWWGRAMDIATGKGPDMYIISNPNRTPNAMDGPTRRRWTRLPQYEGDFDLMVQDANNPLVDNLPFCGGPVNYRKNYDFHKRRYRYARPGMWTNAVWGPGTGKSPANVETYPTIGGPPIPCRRWGAKGQFDPRNWASGIAMYGQMGKGGWYNMGQDGYPPMPTPNIPDPFSPF